MSCSCGPGCGHEPLAHSGPAPAPGEFRVKGRLICTAGDLPVVLTALPEHVRLTRAESGCLSFSVVQDAEQPHVFHLNERFTDRAAFEAHQARTRASNWFALTADVQRDITIEETS